MAGIIFPKNWRTITDEWPILNPGRQERDPDFALQNILKIFLSGISNELQCTFGLGFSGGIDSSCLAVAMYRLKIPFRAITLCPSLEHPDCQYAKMLADQLNFHHSVSIPTQTDIEEAKTAMNKSGDEIYYLLIKAFKNQGLHTIINGDGIDELVGGYPQHQWTQDRPRLYWFEYHWNRLVEEHLKPLNKAADTLKVDVILPFLNPEIIKLLTIIPIDDRTDDATRKKPIRGLALLLDIPEQIIRREKYGLCNALSVKRI